MRAGGKIKRSRSVGQLSWLVSRRVGEERKSVRKAGFVVTSIYMLSINSIAPSFTLTAQDNASYSLEQFRGKYVLLYFYPKDDTPGCTKEACMIRDQFGEFEKLGIVVLGVSADSPERHKEFADKYHLPFLLLADTQKEAIKAYQADGLLFTKRISYLIDPKGVIINVYPDVDPAIHAGEILKDVQGVM